MRNEIGEMRNEKWEMRKEKGERRIESWINKKRFFYWFVKPIYKFMTNLPIYDKFKHNNKVFKHFIGYQKGKIFKPLCIILPQMSGYIK